MGGREGVGGSEKEEGRNQEKEEDKREGKIVLSPSVQ